MLVQPRFWRLNGQANKTCEVDRHHYEELININTFTHSRYLVIPQADSVSAIITLAESSFARKNKQNNERGKGMWLAHNH